MPAAPPPRDWVDPENRRIKAETIAAWCLANGQDPGVIEDPAWRRRIVRDALGVRVGADGKKRYPRASNETWAEAVSEFDARRLAAERAAIFAWGRA